MFASSLHFLCNGFVYISKILVSFQSIQWFSSNDFCPYLDLNRWPSSKFCLRSLDFYSPMSVCFSQAHIFTSWYQWLSRIGSKESTRLGASILEDGRTADFRIVVFLLLENGKVKEELLQWNTQLSDYKSSDTSSSVWVDIPPDNL